MVGRSFASVALVLVAGLFSGCAGLGSDPLPVGAIVTNWTPSSHGFKVVFTENAPKEISLRVVDLTTGTAVVTSASQVTDIGDGIFLVPPQQLVAAHQYRIEALQGSKAVASRTFAVSDSGVDSPANVNVHAFYSAALDSRDTNPETASTMQIAGTGEIKVQGATSSFLVKGTGSMTNREDGMAMTVNINDFKMEGSGETTIQASMLGTGTLLFTGDDPSGSGTIDRFSAQFLNYENKNDQAGVSHYCEKSRIEMQAHGTMFSDGEVYSFVLTQAILTWDDAETGNEVWSSATGTMTLTDQEGSSFDVPLDDEGQDTDTGPITLDDDTSWTGFQPVPFVTGDYVVQEGEHGVQIQYSAAEGTQKTYAGQSFTTIQVSGTPTGGVGGSETAFMVRDGVFAGLVLSFDSSLRRGSQTSETHISLTSIS